jgi:hypothetical protein
MKPILPRDGAPNKSISEISDLYEYARGKFNNYASYWAELGAKEDELIEEIKMLYEENPDD